MGPGDHVAALAEQREGVGDVEHVLGLEPEVELLDDGLREQIDERRGVRQRRDRNAPDEMGCDPRHHAQVAVHESVHLRPLHLDDDFLTRTERRGMHLCNGRRRQRLTLERAEDRLEGPQQIFFDHATHAVERLRRYLIAALAKLDDERLREDALSRRDDLSELDVGRAKAFGGYAQTAEMSAVDVSLPRSRAPHTASGRPRARNVVSMRPTGGTRR